MQRRFVTEAVMFAIYGQLFIPAMPVEYIIPYSTIMELYDLRDGGEPIMPEPQDDAHAKQKIQDLISFFEEPFHRKKIEKALVGPWRKSLPLLINDSVTFYVVNAVDQAQYGEQFDPIETEMLLCAMKEQAPLLTDQLEFGERVIDAAIPVQIYDVEDFEFAVEQGISPEELEMP